VRGLVAAFLSLVLVGCTPIARASSPVAAVPVLESVFGNRFIVDLRYHTADNFAKTDFYGPAHIDSCFVLPEAARALMKLVPELQKRKLKIVFWDYFRPISVQWKMWKLVPDPRYVADPHTGSNHNRGAAVDMTLAHEDGTRLEMPTAFDSFEPTAHGDYVCPPNEKVRCENRELLKSLMTKVGFEVLPTEWWHFQLPGAEKYPVGDRFEKKNAP